MKFVKVLPLMLVLAALVLSACGNAAEPTLTGTVWQWQQTQMNDGTLITASRPGALLHRVPRGWHRRHPVRLQPHHRHLHRGRQQPDTDAGRQDDGNVPGGHAGYAVRSRTEQRRQLLLPGRRPVYGPEVRQRHDEVQQVEHQSFYDALTPRRKTSGAPESWRSSLFFN